MGVRKRLDDATAEIKRSPCNRSGSSIETWCRYYVVPTWVLWVHARTKPNCILSRASFLCQGIVPCTIIIVQVGHHSAFSFFCSCSLKLHFSDEKIYVPKLAPDIDCAVKWRKQNSLRKGSSSTSNSSWQRFFLPWPFLKCVCWKKKCVLFSPCLNHSIEVDKNGRGFPVSNWICGFKCSWKSDQ